MSLITIKNTITSVGLSWGRISAIGMGIIIIVIGNYPYPRGVDLISQSNSEAISFDLADDLIWRNMILLDIKEFVLKEVMYSDNPLIESNNLKDASNEKQGYYKLVISLTKNSKLYLSRFRIPEGRSIHLLSNNKSKLEVNIHSLKVNKLTPIKGKISLKGEAKICLWKGDVQEYCKQIKSSSKFLHSMKSIYFSSISPKFNMKLAINDSVNIDNAIVRRIEYSQYNVSIDYKKNPFSCSLIDGIIQFPTQESARNLLRVNCPYFNGNNFNLKLNWKEGVIKSRIKGVAKTNISLMPTIIQELFFYPALSSSMTLIGWIATLLPLLPWLSTKAKADQ